MAQNEVAVSIKIIGTDKSIDNIKNLKKEIETVTEELEKSDIGSKAYKDLQLQAAQLGAQLGKLEKETEKLQDSFKGAQGIKETLDGISKVSEAFLQASEITTSFYGKLSGNAKEAAEFQEALAKGVGFVKSVSALASAAEEASLIKTIGLQRIMVLQKTLEGAAESKNIVIRNAATAAQWLLNAAMAANPFGLIVTAAAAAAAGLTAYMAVARETSLVEKQSAAARQAAADVDKEATGDIIKHRVELERLRQVITNNTLSEKQRTQALKEYNSLAEAGNRLTVDEINNIDTVNKKISDQTKLFELRAKARAAENIYTKLLTEQAEKDVENSTKKGIGVAESYGNAFKQIFKGNLSALTAFSSPMGLAMANIQQQTDEFVEAQTKIDAAYNEFIKKNNELQEQEKATAATTAETDKLEKIQLNNRFSTQTRSVEVLLNLQKQYVQQYINNIKDGQQREIALENQKYEDIKTGLQNNLKEIDRAIAEDEERKKTLRKEAQKEREKIDEDEKLTATQRAQQLQDISNQEATGIANLNKDIAALKQQRTQSEKEIDKILVEAANTRNNQIAEIEHRYADQAQQERLKQLEDSLSAIDEILNRELELEQRQKDRKKQTEEQYEQDVYTLRKEALKKKLDLLQIELSAKQAELKAEEEAEKDGGGANSPRVKEKEKEVNALIAQQQNLNQTLQNLEEDHTDAVAEQVEKRKELRKSEVDSNIENTQKALSGISDILSTADSAISALGEAMTAQYDERIQHSQDKISELEEAVKNSTGRQKKTLQAQLDAEKAQLKQAEADKDATRRKYAKAKKAMDIIQAEITGVKSALEAYQSLVGIPYVGPVLAAIAAAAAIAFAQVQVAAIAKTPLAQGGNLGNGDIGNVSGGNIPAGAGMISGPSHAGGGVRFNYRGNWYEAEGGELKTHNGNERYIFTKRVAQDPVLRNIALATHNNVGHPLAGIVGSLVNSYAGGRSFGYSMGGVLASGGNLDNVMGNPMQPPVVTSSGSDPVVVKLIADVNKNQTSLREYIDATNRRIDEMKIAVPVDQVTDVQNKAKEVRTVGLF